MGVVACGADAIDHARPGVWQPLMIDGARVEWPRIGRRRIVLRYAFASRELYSESGPNCRVVKPFAMLSERSHVDSEQLRAAAAEAFGRWARVAPLRFEEVADDSSADIVIGEQGEPAGHAFTSVSIGPELERGLRAITGARICLNPERRWKIGFDGNLTAFDIVHTLTHEIGHAIGLDHPGARGAVMAFRYDESVAGLTDADVRGVRALYGSH